MKALLIILSLFLSFSFTANSKTYRPKNSKYTKQTKRSKAKSKKYVEKKLNHTNLQKNMKFDNHRVHGKFMFSQEAVAKVEGDKNLSDLLGLRTHFKDRLEDLSKRY